MLKDVVFVKPLDDYRLFVKFDDGAEGEIDVSALVPFTGVFAPLRDASSFSAVRVNTELGSIEWECGADLDPHVIYSIITGQPLPFTFHLAQTGK